MEQFSRILLTAVAFCYLPCIVYYGGWTTPSPRLYLPPPKENVESVYHGPLMEIDIEGKPWTSAEKIIIRNTNHLKSRNTSQDSELLHSFEKKSTERRSDFEYLQKLDVHVSTGKSPEWLKNASSFLLKVPSFHSMYQDAFANKTYSSYTSAKNSHFRIINPKLEYNLCDTFEIEILVKDGKNVTKQYGGDYFFVTQNSLDTKSSSIPDGGVHDHRNGSYTARFTLRWTGKINITVKLMHSSEAISAIKRVSEKFPTRASYDGFFWNGTDVEVSPCHVTPYFYAKQWENESYVAEICNFTDPVTGSPWFCAKPVNFSCSSYGNHSYSRRDNNIIDVFLSKEEKAEIIKRPSNIFGTGHVKVTEDSTQIVSTCSPEPLPQCDINNQPKMKPKNNIAGFYYRDNWTSLYCNNYIGTQAALPTFISKCLRNKTLYFLGDSTLRQWFVYLYEKLAKRKLNSRVINHASFKMGMDHWKSREHNISLYYHHQGLPNTIDIASTSDLHYVANMIDALPSDGESTIFFMSLAAHFAITTPNFFHDRIKTVKEAISRLHDRSPDSPVLVKSANTRGPNDILRPNWIHEQLNRVLSEEFVGLANVLPVDVWNMTIGHYTGWNIHPVKTVIENEIKLVMSYLCKP